MSQFNSLDYPTYTTETQLLESIAYYSHGIQTSFSFKAPQINIALLQLLFSPIFDQISSLINI